MSERSAPEVAQIGEVRFNQETHNVYWGLVFKLGKQLSGFPTTSAVDEVADLFHEAGERLAAHQSGYVQENGDLIHRRLKPGDRPLYWNGSAIVTPLYRGPREEWITERRAFAEHVVSMARELNADCLVDIGAGPAVIAPFISELTPLPVVNLDASSEAIALADIIKTRYALPWHNIRVDLLAIAEHPERLGEELRLGIPGTRPLIFSRRTIQQSYFNAEQLAGIWDWAALIGSAGGIHFEGLGSSTAAFKTLPSFLQPHLLGDNTDPERNVFLFLEANPLVKIIRRIEIFPQIVEKNLGSVLGWRWR